MRWNSFEVVVFASEVETLRQHARSNLEAATESIYLP